MDTCNECGYPIAACNEITLQRQRIAELERALRPLARACCTEFGLGDGEPDDASVYVEDEAAIPVITFGIIRNALRALGELD